MSTKKRNFLLLIFALLICLNAAFAGNNLSSKEARKAISSMPGLAFDENLIRIKSIDPATNTGSGGAIVEAQFNTAFRLEKRDKWQVAEIRLGNGRWEDAELVTTAIRTEKIKRTRAYLQTLALPLSAYQREQGYYPRAKDIVALFDQLVPRYINIATRTDLWGNYFVYESDGKQYRLRSLGPNGKDNNGDEIILENGNLVEK